MSLPLDIVDIKPANMEELTEVITAAEFHPINCNEFVYSSSKGSIRLCDMRAKALCDEHAKSKTVVIIPCFMVGTMVGAPVMKLCFYVVIQKIIVFYDKAWMVVSLQLIFPTI